MARLPRLFNDISMGKIAKQTRESTMNNEYHTIQINIPAAPAPIH